MENEGQPLLQPPVKKSIQNFGLMSAINKKQSKKEGKKERYPKNLLYTLHSLLLFFFELPMTNFRHGYWTFKWVHFTYAFQ